MPNIDLAATLIAMADEDQRVRTELLEEGVLFDGYHPRMAELHHRNAHDLDAILATVGWPSADVVGPRAADAAWLVLQHSIGDPPVMRRGLAAIRAAGPAAVAPGQLAMLEDRILVLSGAKQRYGTQFDWDEQGEMNPAPIEDPAQVDALRASVGLIPLAEKLEEVRAGVRRASERAPNDLAARRREKEAWRRRVGWCE